MRKQLIVIASVVVVSLFVGLGATLWLSARLVSAGVQRIQASVSETIPSVGSLVSSNCTEAARRLLAPGGWLNTPPAQNIALLKNACFEKNEPPKCEPGNCHEV